MKKGQALAGGKSIGMEHVNVSDGRRQVEDTGRQLRRSAQFLRGVGTQRAELLARLGLRTASDVLFHFPHRYEDLTEITPADQLEDQRMVSVVAEVKEVELRKLDHGRSILGVLLDGENVPVRAVWFNQPFQRSRFRGGQRVLLSGRPKRRGLCWEFTHPQWRELTGEEPPGPGELTPVYRLTDGLSAGRMRKIAAGAVEQLVPLVPEVLPESLRRDHHLQPIADALKGIHQPRDAQQLTSARRRFVFQELLVLQLALALRRFQRARQAQARVLEATTKIDARIRRLFPFELTRDQCRTIDDIRHDMARKIPMNRLLQGEVGSGKTVVAEYAMLLAVAHGCQAVMMAPTEVLARQHLQTLSEDLAESRVRLGLLTGSLTTARRKALLDAVEAGEIDLLVGTQALLFDSIRFHRLGLVVIDEQHKFGVHQRAALKRAAEAPHYLVMTATPIPRTVAMTLFGDLDISTIRETPPGRQNVHTYLASPSQRERWWRFVGEKLRQGRQAYVITPRVLEDSRCDASGRTVASVEQVFDKLSNGPLADFRLDLIHGRMSATEKEAAMQAFRRCETHVLVATSVIEVGVSVPNATVMTIEAAERFGLAQLHQLRGRVRRGNYPGYVSLFAQPTTPESQRRLEALVQSTDGFELSEIDFQLRGPGDLFGAEQHGLPPLRIADLQHDSELLEQARQTALQLVADSSGPFWSDEYAALRQQVLQRYGEAFALSDVG